MRGPCSGRRQRPADVGQQQDRSHHVLGRFGHVGRRLHLGKRLRQCRLLFQSFEIVGLEVLVQQRQRLGQGTLVVAQQGREALDRQREAGHPGQQAPAYRRGRGFGVAIGVVARGGGRAARCGAHLVELEEPGVEPAPARNGLVQHRVAPPGQRGDLGERVGLAGGLGPPRPPVALGHRLRLQQHAAEVAVQRAGVQRRLGRGRRSPFVEQRLQAGDLDVGKITHRCGAHALSCARGVGPRGVAG